MKNYVFIELNLKYSLHCVRSVEKDDKNFVCLPPTLKNCIKCYVLIINSEF